MDNCTLFPEGWWSACCAAHDLAYEIGDSRRGADYDLFMCVATSGEGLLGLASVGIGAVMLLGVRVFGRGFWKPKG